MVTSGAERENDRGRCESFRGYRNGHRIMRRNSAGIFGQILMTFK